MATKVSVLDNNVSISIESWAVTMICNSNSSGKPATSSFGNNHALLAVEGVDKSGNVFRKYIHLMGPASVQTQANISQQQDFHEKKAPYIGTCCTYGMQRIGQVEVKNIKNDYRYTHKSETWLRSADKVRIMLDEAEQEENHPAEFPRPFSILGNKSVFTPDLDTFKITDPLITAIAHCDADLFKKLYEMTKYVQEEKDKDRLVPKGHKWPGELDGIERLNYHYFCPRFNFFGRVFVCVDIARGAVANVWHTKKKVDNLSVDLYSFFAKVGDINYKHPNAWSNILSRQRMYEIMQLFSQTRTHKDRQKLIDCAVGDEKEFFTMVNEELELNLESHKKAILSYSDRLQTLVDKLRLVKSYESIRTRLSDLVKGFNENPLSGIRELLHLIYKSTDLCRITPDSCFTWAREKLSLIDVKLEDKSIESLLSPTKCYLSPINERNWCCLSSSSKTNDLKDQK